jgi:5-oxoprolinase (ATP-hydrolysing) subunit A
MGESYGAYLIGDDEALMSYVSSVNIACGFHGGDPAVMRKTVALASERKLAIGAHPGYQDLQGFGRRNITLKPDEVYDLVLYQIGALSAFLKACGSSLYHVKPHGALYNTAAKDKTIASAIAHAVYDFDSSLILVGLSGSFSISEAESIGLKTASEVFADRTYLDDGSLTPRTMPNSLIENSDLAAMQVWQMIKDGTVTTISGKIIQVKAETVCIHGDGQHALAFAKSIVSLLTQKNVTIQKP